MSRSKHNKKIGCLLVEWKLTGDGPAAFGDCGWIISPTIKSSIISTGYRGNGCTTHRNDGHGVGSWGRKSGSGHGRIIENVVGRASAGSGNDSGRGKDGFNSREHLVFVTCVDNSQNQFSLICAQLSFGSGS